MNLDTVAIGDCREELLKLPECVFRCCVTSPPYWGLRDYGHPGQLGLESSPDEYVATMVDVFREVRRVLADDGTLWLNLGDAYSMSTRGAGGSGKQDTNKGTHHSRRWRVAPGLKPKDLCGIPWRVVFALQADGWWLRSDIIWAKPNPMPESVTDRPTKAHEYVFLLAKSARYYFGADAVAEEAVCSGGVRRNIRTVWPIASQPYSGAHFATMPPKLAERCILAGSAVGDAVLDPFMGSGTVGRVAEDLGRRWFGIELNPEYADMASGRTSQMGLFGRAVTSRAEGGA